MYPVLIMELWHYILLEFLNGDRHCFWASLISPEGVDTFMLEGHNLSKKEPKPERKVGFRQDLGL